MTAGGHFEKKKWKLRFHLKWQEMQTNMNFGHPKWPPAAILWKKMKVAFSSELTRNANENEFQTSKMAAGGHFVKKNESCIFIWNGQKCKQKLISDIQNGCRQPFWAKKMKVVFWSEMVRNANENEFQTSGGHFEKRMKVSFLYNIRGRGTSYIRQYLVFNYLLTSPVYISHSTCTYIL